MRCGLLGQSLKHSYSPLIHSFLGNDSYSLFSISPDALEAFLKEGSFTGINVTIPYKKAVIPYLDGLSDIARELGAVNTIIRRDGKLIGHNTDYYGFQAMLRRSGLLVKDKKVLVLGSGGASSTVQNVLRREGAKVVVISRNGENNYRNLYLHKDCAVLVNATPVGMYPNNGESPLDLQVFPQLEGVLDLIYNPSKTALLLQAEQRGLIIENGLWMLVAQAKQAAEFFMERHIPDSEIGRIHARLQLMMENTLLIGMPGCGKSTVGKLLAQKLGKEFVDCDSYIQQKAHMSIPEIFATQGEAAFRKLETVALLELSKRSGLVIATGGGCVTRPENKPYLRQNGKVIYLKRDLHSLSTEGRPLSQANRLEDMLRERKPLYESICDYCADNNGDISSTVNQILNFIAKEHSDENSCD